MVKHQTISECVSGHYEMADGVSLAFDCRGPDDAPTIVFAHGFGQTRGAWAGAADVMAGFGWRTLCFDARGHGESDRSPKGCYHMQQFVDDMATVVAAQPQSPVVVGASMGGLLGLAVAGEQHTSPLAGLVLVDITPRWEQAGVERVLAFMRARPEGFDDFDDVARAIAAYLPQRARRKSRAQLEPMLRRGGDGRLHWHWDPAMLSSIAEESELYQTRLHEAAQAVHVPLLLLSGEHSDVVSQQTIDEFMAWVPHARHVEVAGATHMLAGDANDAFTQEIRHFIEPIFNTTDTGVAG